LIKDNGFLDIKWARKKKKFKRSKRERKKKM